MLSIHYILYSRNPYQIIFFIRTLRITFNFLNPLSKDLKKAELDFMSKDEKCFQPISSFV